MVEILVFILVFWLSILGSTVFIIGLGTLAAFASAFAISSIIFALGLVANAFVTTRHRIRKRRTAHV